MRSAHVEAERSINNVMGKLARPQNKKSNLIQNLKPEVEVKSPIHVVVGVIINQQNQVLVAKRPVGKHLAGLWEFPGGKVEQGETTQQALVRELQEEVDLTPLHFIPLTQISHEYDEKFVLLDVYLIDKVEGNAKGLEGQQIKWLHPDKFSEYSFPEANSSIITALQKQHLFN